MEIKKIRKFLIDNYKCVKDVRLNDLFDMETCERSGTRATMYLDNKILYAVGWAKNCKSK